jgi:hypothetical protein
MTDVVAGASASSVSAMPAPIMPMRRWRVALVVLVAAFLVGGHLYDAWSQREHWPFSFYPMYGRVQRKPQLQMLSLFVITRDADGKKHRTRITSGDYVPLSSSRLRNILMASWGRDGTAPGAVRRTADILREYARIYELRRKLGLHNGSPLLEVQLCLMTWKVRSDALLQKPRSIESLLGVRARDGARIDYFAQPPAAADAAGAAATQALAPATLPTTEPIEVENPGRPDGDDDDGGNDENAPGD